jgi:hypothetical protein
VETGVGKSGCCTYLRTVMVKYDYLLQRGGGYGS